MADILPNNLFQKLVIICVSVKNAKFFKFKIRNSFAIQILIDVKMASSDVLLDLLFLYLAVASAKLLNVSFESFCKEHSGVFVELSQNIVFFSLQFLPAKLTSLPFGSLSLLMPKTALFLVILVNASSGTEICATSSSLLSSDPMELRSLHGHNQIATVILAFCSRAGYASPCPSRLHFDPSAYNIPRLHPGTVQNSILLWRFLVCAR